MYPILWDFLDVSGLLFTKVSGHVGQGARALGILWLIPRGPIFFFREEFFTITVESGDKKESLDSSPYNIFSRRIHLSE